MYLLKMDRESVEQMTDSIARFRRDIRHCEICNNLSDTDRCPICSNPERDRTTICVVEQVGDLMSIENTRQYRGLYHVLGGVISPMQGVGPSDLKIDYQAENCTLSVPTVTESSGFKEGMCLKVAVSYSGKFTCPDVNTVIPFVFKMVTAEGSAEWSSGDCLIFDRTENGGVNTNGRTSGGAVPTGMFLAFSAADWEAAYPGNYVTVITYTASVATS